MRAIRSLLWVGTGDGLSTSGLTEAPQLDVTWVPNVDEALALPRVHFDGVLIECPNEESGEIELARLRPRVGSTPVIACLPAAHDPGTGSDGLSSAHATFYIDPDIHPGNDPDNDPERDPARSNAGLVSQIQDTLDHFLEAAPLPALPPRTPLPASPPVESAASSTPAAGQVIELERDAPPRVIGSSPGLANVLDYVDRAASSRATVLLTGETGVGKEVIARQLHERGRREDEPFLAINCAAFTEALLESELFGHTRGAFTGADRAKDGLFKAAGEGTLFLDELAEMSLTLQAKLLRALQEREIRPVGGNRVIQVRCRIVAATNRVLAEEVRSGRFREDLFYRLNVFPIRIPPLRERKEDILPLARHFLALHGPREGKTQCHLSLASAQLLQGYGWPGNVRELENEMLRALMLTPADRLITPKALSPKIVEILEPIAHGARPDETLKQAVDRVEAWLIRRALANNGGRRARTATLLGITREGLYKKMKRLGIG